MAFTQITRFMRPTWGPPGSCRPQMGPMLAPWTLLSGYLSDREQGPRGTFTKWFKTIFLKDIIKLLQTKVRHKPTCFAFCSELFLTLGFLCLIDRDMPLLYLPYRAEGPSGTFTKWFRMIFVKAITRLLHTKVRLASTCFAFCSELFLTL